MLVVLQEVIDGDSQFHHLRRCGQCEANDCTHRNSSDWGLPEFFRVFGIFSASDQPTLQRITILVPSRPDDALGKFGYDDLERAPFLGLEPDSRRAITSLANTQAQEAQLDRIIDMWDALLYRDPTMGFDTDQLPTIEFARRPRL